jgi:hypothetical protein
VLVSPAVLSLAALLCAGLTLWLALGLRSLLHETAALNSSLRRAALYHLEGARFIEGREQLARAQETAEALVHGSTTIARGVHHGIAAIPFSILEAIPATRDTTRIIRGVHDLTADTVYGAISAINRVLGQQFRRGLERSNKKNDLKK